MSVSGVAPLPCPVLPTLRTLGPQALSSLFSGAAWETSTGALPFFGIKEHILDSLLAKCDKPKDLGLLGLGPSNVPTYH